MVSPAAEQGERIAQYNLAVMLYRGEASLATSMRPAMYEKRLNKGCWRRDHARIFMPPASGRGDLERRALV